MQHSPYQNPRSLVFVEMEKPVLKFIWKWKGPRIAKTIPKKDEVGELTFPDLKTQKTVKTECYWPKDGHTDPWNRIGSPEISSYIYGQYVLDKRATMRGGGGWLGERIVFNKWYWGNWIPTWKKLSWALTSHHLQKLTWIKDLNVKELRYQN